MNDLAVVLASLRARKVSTLITACSVAVAVGWVLAVRKSAKALTKA